MKCARLHLQERQKSKVQCQRVSGPSSSPRRFCQKRLANPQHEEDPRWIELLQRFRCSNYEQVDLNTTSESVSSPADEELYLSVQTLKFEGDEKQPNQNKSSFKYKKSTDSRNHRLFIKEVVDGSQQVEEDRGSKLSSYNFENYVNDLLQSDKSRPSSERSSVFIQGLLGNFNRTTEAQNLKNKPTKSEKKLRTKNLQISSDKDIKKDTENRIDDSKISFHKTGKRKILTISRTQSPETVQIIRVDVVCNRPSTCSTMTDYDEDKKKIVSNETPESIVKNSKLNFKSSSYFNKYLLMNTVKTLDENVVVGKVTLLCKTFRLTDRSKPQNKKNLYDSERPKCNSKNVDELSQFMPSFENFVCKFKAYL